MKQLTEVEALEEEIAELKSELAGVREELDDAERRLSDYQDDERTAEVITAAVDKFLARCERPVGKCTFTIKAGRMTDTAIMGLFDAVGRNL